MQEDLPFAAQCTKPSSFHVLVSKYFPGKGPVLSSSLPNSAINFMPTIVNICLCCKVLLSHELYLNTNPRNFTILIAVIPAH